MIPEQAEALQVEMWRQFSPEERLRIVFSMIQGQLRPGSRLDPGGASRIHARGIPGRPGKANLR